MVDNQVVNMLLFTFLFFLKKKKTKTKTKKKTNINHVATGWQNNPVFFAGGRR